MEYSDLPTNEKVDAAVKEYAETIVKYIRAIDPKVNYDLDYELMTDEAETQKSVIADIQTEYGFVTIFPDFNKIGAKAALLNRGKILAMELEGFDDDTINSTEVHGTLMPYTLENAETFAFILTQDFGLQHQKLLLE